MGARARARRVRGSSAPDAGLDAAAEDTGAAPEPCATEGAIECSSDAYSLRECTGGAWQVRVDCVARSQLCEDEACVDPWTYGSPTFDGCEGDPLATSESLADKATYYDESALRLHVHPELGWIMGVVLDPSAADPGLPAVAQESATYDDVERWLSGENDGLWSALYLASQAYRYAATADAEALDTIRRLMQAERRRMQITGVSGLFTRQMIPPGIRGLACPTDLAAYVPDLEKDDNQWVRVGATGCVEVVDWMGRYYGFIDATM